MNALVIDDRADIQEIIRYCLANKLGWRVSTAVSFEKGLALADIEQPSVVLVSEALLSQDKSIREFQLIRLKSAKDIPVILLANRVRLIDKRLFQELGIAAVIAQPFDPLHLSEQIDTIVQQKSARQESTGQKPSD